MLCAVLFLPTTLSAAGLRLLNIRVRIIKALFKVFVTIYYNITSDDQEVSGGRVNHLTVQSRHTTAIPHRPV